VAIRDFKFVELAIGGRDRILGEKVDFAGRGCLSASRDHAKDSGAEDDQQTWDD
jgi:hypothetical protein